MKPTLYILTGCTAVGKTEWALRWAERQDAEIVSCDSLLFYRGMDIGTAKPSSEERARVPHHMIDICDLADGMDVTRYVEQARGVVRDIAQRGRRVLVTGGSGFYLRAFFTPVADGVEVAPELRAEIAARLDSQGLAVLVEELRALNPSGTGRLDTNNPRRVVRALERCRASGKTLRELEEEFAKIPPPFAEWNVQLACLQRGPAELNQRIDARIEAMLRAGLIEEVERLLPLGLKKNPSAAIAIGYRETIDVIEGRLPRAELAPTIMKNTRGLVKKQRTWFRTQLPPHRVIDAHDCEACEKLFALS
jgi:tRNA dimethylallyltransferase